VTKLSWTLRSFTVAGLIRDSKDLFAT